MLWECTSMHSNYDNIYICAFVIISIRDKLAPNHLSSNTCDAAQCCQIHCNDVLQLPQSCACVIISSSHQTICHLFAHQPSLYHNLATYTHVDLVNQANSEATSSSFVLVCIVWENTSLWKRMKLYYDIIADYPWLRWLSQDIMADRIIRDTVAWLYTFNDTCPSLYDISTTRITYKQPYGAKIDRMYSKVAANT